MQPLRLVVLMLPIVCTLLRVSPCTGQATQSGGQSDVPGIALAKQFQAHALEEAAAYEIRKGSPTGPQLTLRAEPILRWTNPVPEKQMQGDVFLWTDDGRPAAVLCLFQMTEVGGIHEYHEFSSLATTGLVTTGGLPRNWSPANAQLAMTAVHDAPVPAESPRQRLSQMRELAGRFTCEKTTRMGDTRALRLLSQPVARYESKSHGVIDGALFTFVEATDPEVFLVLEMRPAGTTSQWHYGLARMASVRMQVSLAGRIVWEVETLPYDGYRNRPDLPYTLFFAR
jgi:hypothetical protein